MNADLLQPISPRAFRRIRALFRDVSGIDLAECKQPLVASRLRKRLESLGLPSFDAYCAYVDCAEGAGERRLLIDLLTTNETYFFREPVHFRHLAERVLPALGGASLRVWSAAASSGEEAYSIAMLLEHQLGPGRWEIVATDLSRRMLERAARAVYPLERLQNLPRPFLCSYCLKGTGAYAGTLRVTRSLRTRVRFAEHNLLEMPRGLGAFDLVFLRNVLIYFDNGTKERILRHVLSSLRPGGWLYVGRSESLHGLTLSLPLEAEQPSIYRLRSAP